MMVNEYIMEDEKDNPMVDAVTRDHMIRTRKELNINTSLNFSNLEDFFIFPNTSCGAYCLILSTRQIVICDKNQRPVPRLERGRELSPYPIFRV